jgi:xanthine dehydrogenase accessory factor
MLRPIAERPRPYATRGVAYLPILPRCRLVIVGGGHVGKAVAELAADLDFAVWIVDDRAEYTEATRFPRVERRLHGPIDQVLPALDVTPDTYCLIVTRGHSHDERALYYLADRGARYVGLIGSRRKIKLIFDDLRQEGVSVEACRTGRASESGRSPGTAPGGAGRVTVAGPVERPWRGASPTLQRGPFGRKP